MEASPRRHLVNICIIPNRSCPRGLKIVDYGSGTRYHQNGMSSDRPARCDLPPVLEAQVSSTLLT
jgi:hypothetical protein